MPVPFELSTLLEAPRSMLIGNATNKQAVLLLTLIHETSVADHADSLLADGAAVRGYSFCFNRLNNVKLCTAATAAYIEDWTGHIAEDALGEGIENVGHALICTCGSQHAAAWTALVTPHAGAPATVQTI